MKNSNNNTYMFKGNDTLRSLNDASFYFAQFIGAELEKIGMRASYRHVMKPLMETDGLTQLELVNITKLKAPTISITLRNMERDGIVRREKDDNDRRETHVYITEKGRDMHARVLEAYDKAEKIMLEGLTAEELAALSTPMEKMINNLKAKSGGDSVD